MADRPTLTITVAENGMLTLEDIAKLAGVRRQTVSFWASDKQPFARRLRALRLGHSCVRVRPADWLKFQEAKWVTLPGCYYTRKPVTAKTDKALFTAAMELLIEATAKKDREKKWLAQYLLDGMPVAVSNFEMRCLYILRGSEGDVTRLVKLMNTKGEVSKGSQIGGADILPNEMGSGSEKYREWVQSKGNFTWGGEGGAGNTELQWMQLDVTEEAAYKEVKLIEYCGWHELKVTGPRALVPGREILHGFWIIEEGLLLPPGEGAREVSGGAPDTAREARALPAAREAVEPRLGTAVPADKNVRDPLGEGAREVSGGAPDTAREARALPADKNVRDPLGEGEARGRILPPDEDGVFWFEGEGYAPSQKGRELDFIQGRPRLRPELTIDQVKFDTSDWEQPGSDNDTQASASELYATNPMGAFFRETCRRFFETAGGMEGFLAVGAVLGYAAAPEIYAKQKNFPSVWVSGQMGSGKSTFCSWLCALQGLRVPMGMGLISKNVTAVGIACQLENYSNILLWLDEYRQHQIAADKEPMLRDCYGRQLAGKWSPDGKQRQIRTMTLVSGESTTSDAATRSRYPHVLISEQKRLANHYDWMQNHQEYFFFFFRELLYRRPEFVGLVMEEIERWMTDPALANMPAREKVTHSVCYAAFVAAARMFGSHSEEEIARYCRFLAVHAANAADDVASDVNIHVFIQDLIVAYKAGAIPNSCFRVSALNNSLMGLGTTYDPAGLALLVGLNATNYVRYAVGTNTVGWLGCLNAESNVLQSDITALTNNVNSLWATVGGAGVVHTGGQMMFDQDPNWPHEMQIGSDGSGNLTVNGSFHAGRLSDSYNNSGGVSPGMVATSQGNDGTWQWVTPAALPSTMDFDAHNITSDGSGNIYALGVRPLSIMDGSDGTGGAGCFIQANGSGGWGWAAWPTTLNYDGGSITSDGSGHLDATALKAGLWDSGYSSGGGGQVPTAQGDGTWLWQTPASAMVAGPAPAQGVFTNAVGARFALVVNAQTNGFVFVPLP